MWERQLDREIPQLLTLICSLYYYVGCWVKPAAVDKLCGKLWWVTIAVNIYKGPSQVGSLAGAAHLLNDNAGVLW